LIGRNMSNGAILPNDDRVVRTSGLFNDLIDSFL
jgi:hypothetical protein